MTKQATLMKKTRARNSDACREEAFAIADRAGAAAAARELGLQPAPSVRMNIVPSDTLFL